MSTKLKIFAVLIALAIFLVAGYVIQSSRYFMESSKTNNVEDPLRFSNIGGAKSWFSKKYTTHEFSERKFESITVHSFYGLKGSGIQRVDAYFYGCDAQGCALLGMKSNTEARRLEGNASVEIKNGILTIESKDNFRFTFTLSQ
jgi:hypothetical protein